MLELGVVVMIIGVLLALLLPAYNLAKVRTERTVCGVQVQQLGTAWMQFADDNLDDLVDNQPLLGAGIPNDDCWFPGSARLDHDPIYGPAPFYTSTNQALARRSKLYPYLNRKDAFRCPSDTRAIAGHRVVRSYSINSWMNGQSMGDPSGHMSRARDDRQNDPLLKFRFFRKQSHISAPADLFVFMEESETTLTDSMFSAVKDLPATRDLADFPASRHGYSAVMTYADGHIGFFRVSTHPRFRTLTSMPEGPTLQDQDIAAVGLLATEPR